MIRKVIVNFHLDTPGYNLDLNSILVEYVDNRKISRHEKKPQIFVEI